MNILYLGDVMAEPGLKLIERELPKLKKELDIDFVVAQAENLSEGKGVMLLDLKRLLAAGVDFCTGGNHTIAREAIFPQLSDPNQPIVRPANYPLTTPGKGYKYAQSKKGPVLVVSLLGKIVGKDADKPMENPLQTIDAILAEQKGQPRVATVVNFHGDYSSEKVVIGHYLDGRVTMVVGDHWHVPTADARVLPKGTAHISDVGMCGTLNSSLGVTYQSIIPRWLDGQQTRNALAYDPPFQLNALLVKSNDASGLAESAEHIRRIYER